jgi:hypothetical protein
MDKQRSTKYIYLVVSTSRSFPNLRIITGFVTRLTRRMPLVEQELVILPEHLSSPPLFSWVCVTRSLVLYIYFVDRCLSICTFYFGHCVFCSSTSGIRRVNLVTNPVIMRKLGKDREVLTTSGTYSRSFVTYIP